MNNKRTRICCVCNDVFYLDKNIPFTYHVECNICKYIPKCIRSKELFAKQNNILFVLNYIFNR